MNWRYRQFSGDSGVVPILIVFFMAFIFPGIVYAFPPLLLIIFGVIIAGFLAHEFIWWPFQSGYDPQHHTYHCTTCRARVEKKEQAQCSGQS